MFADLYAKYYDLLNSQKDYEKEVRFVHGWAGNPKSILDIGCGTASYWRYFPRSTRLLGVEKSKAMAKNNPNIVCTDIADYKPMDIFACAISLFHAMNYIPNHAWWENLPIRSGAPFIFDIWDKKKVDEEGFRQTYREIDGVTRRIRPIQYTGKFVELQIDTWDAAESSSEVHKMYVWSDEDIERFCSPFFKLVETRPTDTWQKYYKCVRK